MPFPLGGPTQGEAHRDGICYADMMRFAAIKIVSGNSPFRYREYLVQSSSRIVENQRAVTQGNRVPQMIERLREAAADHIFRNVVPTAQDSLLDATNVQLLISERHENQPDLISSQFGP